MASEVCLDTLEYRSWWGTNTPTGHVWMLCVCVDVMKCNPWSKLSHTYTHYVILFFFCEYKLLPILLYFFPVWSWRVLPVSAWVLSNCSSFLPQSKVVHLGERQSGRSELILMVNVSGNGSFACEMSSEHPASHQKAADLVKWISGRK